MSFLCSFGAAVESLTPGSTVALWDIILSDITTNHLPAVMHQASQSSVDPPPTKKKKKDNKQVAGVNGDAVARFEAAATVLHTFLMNSKMADAAEVGQVKGQVLKLFDMTADDVLKPLLGIFSHENQVQIHFLSSLYVTTNEIGSDWITIETLFQFKKERNTDF